MQIIDDDQAETQLPLQAPRPGCAAPRESAPACRRYRDGAFWSPLAGFHQPVELRLVQFAFPYLVAGYLRVFREDPGSELFSRHFEREEADDRLSTGISTPCSSTQESFGRSDVESDVRRSAVLPMDGLPARMTRSDLWSPPSIWSSFRNPVGTPPYAPSRLLAAAAMSIAPFIESAKLRKPPSLAAVRREIVEALFGRLDLLHCAVVGVVGVGIVDDVCAEVD